MLYKFFYLFPEAKKVSLIGDFNNWQGDKNPMEMDEEGVWCTELKLKPAEYYYKFLIDDKFTMNDPTANMYLPYDKEEEKLASVYIINEKGQHMQNTRTYKLHLENYLMSDKILNTFSEKDKKHFENKDEKVLVHFNFTEVEGIHTLSIVWNNPEGKYYHYTEGILWQEKMTEPVDIWFWLDLKKQMTSGEWYFDIYLNGAFQGGRARANPF